jgi:hypothetical protein
MDNLLKIHYMLKYHPDLALFVQASPASAARRWSPKPWRSASNASRGVPVASVTYDGIGGSKNNVIIPYLAYARVRLSLEHLRRIP